MVVTVRNASVAPKCVPTNGWRHVSGIFTQQMDAVISAISMHISSMLKSHVTKRLERPFTLKGVALSVPFTLAFLVVMAWANAQAGVFRGDLPSDVLKTWGISQSAILDGQFWRLVTATFLSHDPGMVARQAIFAGVVIGYTEWRVGTMRAALLFFGLDTVASLLLMLSISLLPHLADVMGQFDVGMSMGGFGLIGYAILQMRRPVIWLCVAVAAVGVKILLNFEPLVDSGHMLALWLGVFVGLCLRKRGANAI